MKSYKYLFRNPWWAMCFNLIVKSNVMRNFFALTRNNYKIKL